MTLGIFVAAIHTSIRPEAPKKEANSTLRTNPLTRLKKIPAPTVNAARERRAPRRAPGEGVLTALLVRWVRFRTGRRARLFTGRECLCVGALGVGTLGEQLVQELALFLEFPHLGRQSIYLSPEVREPLGSDILASSGQPAAFQASGEGPAHRRIQDDGKDRNQEDEHKNHHDHSD